MNGETTPTAKLPAAGEVIGDAYTIVRRLGVGGMGAVFEVENKKRACRSAMKIMLPNLAIDAEFRARFEREARISSMVTSAHVAEVQEVGSLADGRLFMVMELLVGNDLEHELRARGPLPPEEVAGWVIQACDALHEAHKQGIVHRDLKPANLYLSRAADGARVVKVLDFGISKKLGSTMTKGDGPTLTTTDSMLGSPKYMSPEHLRNPKLVDARSDIWSLGVILYKLLSDRLPFDGESLGAYVSMVVAEDPSPLATPELPLPPGLVRVVMRCLEKDPKTRFRTVAQLAVALQPFAPRSVLPIIERLRREDPSSMELLPEPTITDKRQLTDSTLTDRSALSTSLDAMRVADAKTFSRRGAELSRAKSSSKVVWAALLLLAGAGVAAVVFLMMNRADKAGPGAGRASDTTESATKASGDATGSTRTGPAIEPASTASAASSATPEPVASAAPSTSAGPAPTTLAQQQRLPGPTTNRADDQVQKQGPATPVTNTNTVAPPPTSKKGPMETLP